MQKYIKLILNLINVYKEKFSEPSFGDMCNFLERKMHGSYDTEDDDQWDAYNNAMLFVLIKENPSSDLVERYGTAEQIYAYSDWESQKQQSDNLAMAYGRGDHNISMKDLQDEQALTDKSWNEFIATIKGE